MIAYAKRALAYVLIAVLGLAGAWLLFGPQIEVIAAGVPRNMVSILGGMLFGFLGGILTSLAAALQDSALRPDDVDYVNAHATATELNDRAELAAFRRVFGEAAALDHRRCLRNHHQRRDAEQSRSPGDPQGVVARRGADHPLRPLGLVELRV